ncbi:MAG TPA: O-antigen ligase family protein [Lentimicrobium sp.]|nr:O-antigen ligase family protein [Lentimicrobium sp.]
MDIAGAGESLVQKKTFPGDATSWMFYIMVLLVISLPLSEFGMSISQFLLFGFWIFEGADYSLKNQGSSFIKIVFNNISGKFRMLFSNYILLTFLAFYLLLVAGLLYTEDLDYGLKDLRVKLPLFTLPILIATSTALNNRKFITLLLFFTMAVIAGSLISFTVYLTRPISDPREISIFISHIRFGLFIALSVFILFGLLRYHVFKSRTVNILLAIAACWLLVFLFILKSFTGISITVIVGIILLLTFTFRNRWIMIPVVLLLLISLSAGYKFVNSIYKDLTVAKPLPELKDKAGYTSLGNTYTYDTLHFGIEYGSYVGSFLSLDELKEAWNKRSEYNFEGNDKKGQEIKYTLIRFLHSKGYRKDAEGVNKLSAEEVQQIENGVTNAEYIHGLSIKGYIEQVIMGYLAYEKDNNPNASSLMQRIEYWKTSVYIIKKHLLFGQGTGDVKQSFETAYNETNSNLLPEYRHRAHNQFLTITVAMGIIGLLVFFVSVWYPPVALGKFRNYYYLSFFLIAVISFLTEDTLETQAGATFFAFFSALLLFGVRKEVDENSAIYNPKGINALHKNN